jgi:hypothetical protein
MSAPLRTFRIIGLVLTAAGRAVDIALVETDGGAHVRRVETERARLGDGPLSLPEVVRTFMGDRALQPFAVDLVALADDPEGKLCVSLEQALEVAVVVPDATPRQSGFAAAEHVALAGALQLRRVGAIDTH